MISKQQALKKAKELYGFRDSIEYKFVNYHDYPYRVYNLRNPDEIWCLTVNDHKEEIFLKSTTIVLIHKESGKVIYHGSADDEG